MLRKASDMGISFHRGPFMSKGNLEWGGGACIPETLNDELRRARVISLRGDSMRGARGGGLLYWRPRKIR